MNALVNLSRSTVLSAHELEEYVLSRQQLLFNRSFNGVFVLSCFFLFCLWVLGNKFANWCNVWSIEGVIVYGHVQECHVTFGRDILHNVRWDPHIDHKTSWEKKKEIWPSPMIKPPIPTENSKTKGQHTNATKNFDYTTIADRLRTVSWSNKSSNWCG